MFFFLIFNITLWDDFFRHKFKFVKIFYLFIFHHRVLFEEQNAKEFEEYEQNLLKWKKYMRKKVYVKPFLLP